MHRTTLLSLLFATGCATSLSPVPGGWQSVPQAARVTDLCARVTCATKASSAVRIDGGRLMVGDQALTPAFPAIQSFDVSLDRREVVFSAKRGDHFDVGLVSLDGSEVHWVPSEPVDETDVQWAPRGNKVSYTVHTRMGDVVRTVHIPTGTQLTVPFGEERVNALAWDPPAERFAVVVESAVASPRVESMKYSGEQRREVVPPAVRLDVATEPLTDGFILRPSAMRYNERLPVAVWVDTHLFAWNDARAALMRTARLVVAVVPGTPDAAFWNDLRKIGWIDSTRVYVVDPQDAGRRTGDAGPAIIIAADHSVPKDHYRRDGNLIRAAVDDIQSFAAAFIADELKPNNGRP